jgi:3-hydroxyisobutyrate dehydrogenase-like beta-hydroxyacid dehydrogenase
MSPGSGSKSQVGMIGFGIMGAAIARRLIEHGHEVVVVDTRPAALDAAKGIGCHVAATPAEAARAASTVLLSLPTPEHVTAVVRTGGAPLLDGAVAGSVIVDTSTVDPATSQQNAKAAAERGVGYLDSPVLGRPSRAGQWTLPTGGDADDIAKVRPVLAAFANRIVHVGPSGSGNTVKLLNNLMFGAINGATVEMFALAERLGVEAGLLFNAIADSGAGTVSNLFKELGPKIVEREFSPAFTIDNMEKDVRLGLELAEEAGMTLPLSEAGQRLTRLAQVAGLGAEDSAAVVKVLERETAESEA